MARATNNFGAKRLGFSPTSVLASPPLESREYINQTFAAESVKRFLIGFLSSAAGPAQASRNSVVALRGSYAQVIDLSADSAGSIILPALEYSVDAGGTFLYLSQLETVHATAFRDTAPSLLFCQTSFHLPESISFMNPGQNNGLLYLRLEVGTAVNVSRVCSGILSVNYGNL